MWLWYTLQAEKNLAWEAAQQQAQAQAQLNAMGAQQGSGPCKLLVTNLNIRLAVSTPLSCNTCTAALLVAVYVIQRAGTRSMHSLAKGAL